jgi:hypothetical protein
MAYDPAKAALFNKLRQQGMSENAAADQAGIPEGSADYVFTGKYNADGTLNPNPGTLGADVQGSAKVAGVDYDRPTAAEAAVDARAARAEAADSARFDQGLQSPSNFEQVDFQVEAKNPPSKVTPINYTTTSTETVSGGGSTTVTAGARTPNAASASLQPAIDAKQAEQTQFIKDNPSDFARKKQGLPPLTPEEKQQRQEKLDTLSAEKEALVRKQENSETPGTPTVTTVPNTTTTTETVTSGTTSTDQAVDFNNDQQLSQQTEGQIDARTPAPNADTAAAAAPVTPEELGNDYGFTSEEADGADATQLGEPDAVDDPFEQSRLDAEAEINDNPIDVDPADVDPADDPFEAERLEREQELNRQELAEQTAEPAAVTDDPTVYPTDEETIAQDANQAAARAQLQAADAQEAAAQQAATLDKARAQNTIAQQRSNKNNADWRVKLRLAPLADYLYMAKPPGILAPLAPDGVIFPYTPTIQTSYKATYATTDITHSNYRGYFYQGSAVEPFTISSTFTAQSTAEAEYLLAVIHFFKSVTKMFYGQDPQRGTPPPLVYLTGLGEFQFNEHPCVVSGFTYDLPADVDYIRAYSPNVNNSNMLQQRQSNNSTGPGTSWGNGILGGVLGGAVNRLASSKLFNGQPLPKGGQNIPPPPQTLGSNTIPTYVPTKMTIAVSLLPVVSRQAQSQRFSVRQYATGDLQKGGMW